MTDRQDRSDRLRKRFERGEDDDPDDDTTASQAASSASSADSSTSSASSSAGSSAAAGGSRADGESVKDRPSVLMYLPERTRRELDIRFDELNARHKREHGEPLEKNRDYYPAVIRAGLEGESVEDVLGL